MFRTTIIPTIVRRIITKVIGPQNGSVTNHQDQLITPTSFNTIKAIPNNPRILGLLQIICFSIKFI